MTCLDPKEISWPKVLSGGPEIPKLTGGLVEAQPVVQVSSFKKGSLVKPSFFQVNSDAQSMQVIGESSRGILCGESESPESADASALNVDQVCGAPVVSPSVMVSVRVALKSLHAGESSSLDGFSPMVDSGAPGAETVMESARCLSVVDPNAGKVGSSDTVSPALKNVFSPSSELGNEMGTVFGEGEDQDEDFSDHHEVMVQPRSVASVGFSHNDSGFLFLPWENNGVDICGGGSGVKDNCLLECNPLTQWDPNTLGEVVMV